MPSRRVLMSYCENVGVIYDIQLYFMIHLWFYCKLISSRSWDFHGSTEQLTLFGATMYFPSSLIAYGNARTWKDAATEPSMQSVWQHRSPTKAISSDVSATVC